MDPKYKQLQRSHGMDGCNGTLIPQFLFVTERQSLHVQGYCSRCGAQIWFEENLVELIALCPKPRLAALPPSLEQPAEAFTDEQWLRIYRIAPDAPPETTTPSSEGTPEARSSD